MKIKSDKKVTSDQWQVTSGKTRNSSLITRHSEKGVALIITLILLSVTLFMAIAFLAISRRERGSVTTATDTATARLAADSALANAQAQIIANIFATTNPFNSGLLVSTNYINPNGFISGVVSVTNVNYDFLSGGGALNPNQFEQNVANLFLSPRAPVFVTTNRQSGASEFRFFLDLNRNGKFEDTSGSMPQTNNLGQQILDANNNPINLPETGDPQWIGVLERPDAPHGPNNKFLSRYAFVVVPADSLDWNYIHNQTLHGNAFTSVDPPPPGGDTFFRNQGIGSWEINLAAFLADLNTNVNEWGNDVGQTAIYYRYNQLGNANSGNAFDDARALLAYRYQNNYSSLAFASALFPNGALALGNTPFDIYPFGAVMTGTAVPFYPNLPASSWAGANNTNHFFNLTADLFDPTKSSGGTIGGFTNRLLQAGTNVSTYNRYTFYRLLSQLGTDSKPESGKMNLNYDNLDINGNVISDAETNLISWTTEPNGALRFFTNAADRMLRTYTTKWFQSDPSNYLAAYYNIHTNYFYTDSGGNVHTNDPNGIGLVSLLGVPNALGLTNDGIPSFGVTNIPVYVNGRYVYLSAIQRVLQLSANIYDATTNSFFPDVFRPIYNKNALGNVSVIGYINLISVSGPADPQLSLPFNVETIAALSPGISLNLPSNDNIYGVPWIIGAKKGFPNINAFSMESAFQLTRKLQLTRPSTNTPVSDYKINQMFNCSVSNQFAVECWNSYVSNYTRLPLGTTISVSDHIQMAITNDQTTAQLWPQLDTTLFTSMTTNNWPGTGVTTPMNPNSFLITGQTNLTAIALPPATYLFNGSPDSFFQPIGTNTEPTFPIPNSLQQPHWGLTITNNLQVVMIDNSSGHVIDYVQLRGPITNRDLTAEILSISNNQATSSMWLTNFVSSGVLEPQSLPLGVEAQLQASKGPYISALWSGQNETSVERQIDGFLKFLNLTPIYGNTNAFGSTNLQIQAAYTPTATPVQIINWRANDPLVHYIASDLFDSAKGTVLQNGSTTNALIPPTPNERYQPWGKSSQMANVGNVDQNPSNLAFKDPLALSSDYWDFPANKFPTVGWLGRVHRGTPWQTVYLKSADILTATNSSGANIGTNTWMNWTGDFTINDAVNDAPEQDRSLFDIFTTALNDNATRGRLSINVAANPNDPAAGLAAWSALFSGVVVLHNNLSDAAFLQTPPGGGPRRGGGQAPSSAPALSYTNFLVDPAGVNGTNSPLGQLVVSINSTRANTNLFPQQTFGTKHGVGDILAVPAFTDESPFLNRDAVQITNGISDELYEWLPQQTMGLLTVSSTPRYVIYSYGQTLKPAPNGITTDSSFFGMVTNYQVVSEIATRAVVQVVTNVVRNANSTLTTNYTMKIEQFNILPPD